GDTGRLQVLVREAIEFRRGVNLRDSPTAPPQSTAAELMRPVLTLSVDTPIYEALHTMRETRTHLAVVTGETGGMAGLITITDVLRRLLPTATGEPDQRVV